MGIYIESKTVDGITYQRERTEYESGYEGPWSEWQEVINTPAAPTMSYQEALAILKRMKR